MPYTRYLRAETGDGVFTEAAARSGFGPRFDEAVVRGADLMTVHYVEAETVRNGEIVEWTLISAGKVVATATVEGKGLRKYRDGGSGL